MTANGLRLLTSSLAATVAILLAPTVEALELRTYYCDAFRTSGSTFGEPDKPGPEPTRKFTVYPGSKQVVVASKGHDDKNIYEIKEASEDKVLGARLVLTRYEHLRQAIINDWIEFFPGKGFTQHLQIFTAGENGQPEVGIEGKVKGTCSSKFKWD